MNIALPFIPPIPLRLFDQHKNVFRLTAVQTSSSLTFLLSSDSHTVDNAGPYAWSISGGFIFRHISNDEYQIQHDEYMWCTPMS